MCWNKNPNIHTATTTNTPPFSYWTSAPKTTSDTRHIEGGESDDEEYDNFNVDYSFGGLSRYDSGLSSLRQLYDVDLASITSFHQGLLMDQQLLDYQREIEQEPEFNELDEDQHVEGEEEHDEEQSFELHLENDPDVELDSDIDIAEEQAHINRVMGYKNYPEFLIDDADAGFPLLHEIGETIAELQLIMHAHIMKYSLSL